MRLPPPHLLRRALLAVALLALILLSLHWRPTRQVRLHQKHLQEAVENRDWKKMTALLSPDYADRWRQNRKMLMDRVPQAFQDFLACGVLGENETTTWRDGACELSSHIRIVGSGGIVAQYVMDQTQQLKEPFVFKWRRQSWKPWDWVLVEVDQPELSVPRDADSESAPTP